jgi:primosomal protein N' (replication factor Y)
MEAMGSRAEGIVEVALPLPLQKAFSYRVREGHPVPTRGVRVLVPFAGRRVIGVVTGPGTFAERSLKDVLQVLDEVPLVSPQLLDLAAWMADHYLAPPGECYRLLLPPSGVRASRAVARLVDGDVAPGDPLLDALRKGPLRISTLERRLGEDPAGRLAHLRRAGQVVIDQDLETPGFREVHVVTLKPGAEAARGRAQAEILRRLREAGGQMKLAALVRARPSLRGAVRGLERLGAVTLQKEREDRDPPVLPGHVPPPPALTEDQTSVLRPLLETLAANRFAPFLLEGVTGSGKTEVYFRAAAATLDAGRGVLILVPEIALTPLLVKAAVARFGSRVAVLHSELSAGERHDQWWRIRDGDCPIVVGARSAVFAPLSRVGLIVVDEEHEAAYKQEESPRYHGRDVAVVRAKLEEATVILGSATPSIETSDNARKGKYARLELPRRVGASGLPRIEIVDRRAILKSGGDSILTPLLLDALRERLSRKEQSLLLLNRRGYATSLLCRECGLQAACPNCSVCLVVHRGGRAVECHYCGYQKPAPGLCGSCGGEYLRLAGYGTEKVVEAVGAALPKARVERLDRDLAVRRGAVARVLQAFEAGEIDVLVGTQMIAKGHDFPRVTLVGVVDADVGLGLPDFRAAERTFQLLTQVAGRAGRGDLPGQVILQSHLPDHYALQLACEQDYTVFFDREMEFRRTMGYPPSAALVNLIVRSKERRRAAEDAQVLARSLRQGTPRYRVLGPAQAPLARLKEEYRYQILLKGPRAEMRRAVRRVLVERFGDTRWPGIVVDVEPMSVM